MMAIVAEMMIWANSAVAERVKEAYPAAALVRRHPPPRLDVFEEVSLPCFASICLFTFHKGCSPQV